MKKLLFFFSCCCLSLGVAGLCWAEDSGQLTLVQPLTVDQVKISTPNYQPEASEFDLPLGTYTYEVSWQGIPAAKAELEVLRDGDAYRVTTTARTYSGIDLFYRLRYLAKALFSSKDMRPQYSYSSSKENSRQKDVEIKFLSSGKVESTRTESGKDPQYISFSPKNVMLDPFSAAFLARSLKWRLGEIKYFDTFNGKNRYLIRLKAEDKVTMNVNGVSKEVWVISPTVNKLNGEDDTKKKLRRAWIYVTADKSKEILQIKSEVFVGSVTTKMIAYAAAPGATNLANADRPRKVWFR